MGNKFNVDLKSRLDGKQISTEKLKEIYAQYAPKNDLKRSIPRNVATTFITQLFRLYDINPIIFKDYKKVCQ